MPEKTKKFKSGSSKGFTFEFGGGTQKIKALVARKRQPTVNKEISSTDKSPLQLAPKSIAIRKKVDRKPSANESLKSNKIANNHSDNDSDVDTYLKLARPAATVATDLMLNVCTAPNTIKPRQMPKLSQRERIQQKREARKGDGPLTKRFLTQKELKTGIKKFTQNPNQKPRASDLFVQKEKEAKETLNKQEADVSASPVKEPLELGEVDPAARKSNAFRMKRPGDSSVRKIGLFKDQPEKIEVGQRFVKPITEKIFDNCKLDSLGLHAHTVKNLSDLLGISQLTTVQQKCVPKALEGKQVEKRNIFYIIIKAFLASV